jgi:hypothetical protein
MFYAKLDANQNVERYPYTLTDLRFDTPNTSFPEQINDATASLFGLVLVKPTTPPAENYTFNLERTAIKESGKWVEKWLQTPASPEQVQQRTAASTRDARQKRNQLLADCDWTQLPDAPVETATWATYRQELRDITKQVGFPWEIIWPEINVN